LGDLLLNKEQKKEIVQIENGVLEPVWEVVIEAG